MALMARAYLYRLGRGGMVLALVDTAIATSGGCVTRRLGSGDGSGDGSGGGGCGCFSISNVIVCGAGTVAATTGMQLIMMVDCGARG